MRKPPEAQFLDQCREGLGRAREALIELHAAAPRAPEVLDTYNAILVGAGNSGNLAGLMAEVHPDDPIRDAARTVEQEVSTFASELHLDGDVYRALAGLDLAAADAETRRFVEHTLRDFRRAGVDRDAATRDRLQVIDEELTKLGQQFSKNLAEDVRSISAPRSRLAGLPQDWLDSHPPGDDGNVKITTDYPDYNPFMAYAEDDDLRRQLYIQNRSRGGDGNEQLLHDILTLRAEKAGLLGFANWADYVTEDKMIKSGSRAGEFIERVWQLSRERARRDYDELLAELDEHQRGATEVADWQKVWLETQVKKKKYRVDSERVREYFPYDEVLAGLLDITATIYELQYVPARGVDVWHADVRVFDVVRTGAKLGRIYLDMHPRDGKYKHAAQFNLRDGVTDVQLPEGVLVCNFPRPDAQNPGLMEHDDVVTMFHEFGHLMHHVLGGHHRWVRQSGVATEMDFVEAPSQMFEEWAWSWDTLARFARHWKTGEIIPRDLVTDMRRADKLGIGTQTVQQMFYAAISLGFHTKEPARLDQLDELKRLQAKYTPFAYVDGTRFHAGFGHLVGYSAMYYTYMWSLVIAKDMLSAFDGSGLMDTSTTRRYRDCVLAAGGTKDAADLVSDFLGRQYSFDAFEKYLAE